VASWIKNFFEGSKQAHRNGEEERKSPPFVPAKLPPRRDGKKSKPVEIYADFRLRALSHSRDSLQLPQPPGDAPAWGLLMETASPKGVTSLLALADGTTGICFSGDGSIVAGQNHEAFKKVARGFIRLAGHSLPLMIGAEDFPSPSVGQTTFYVFTDYGIFAASAPESYLTSGQSSLSPLFYAGHVVISQLQSDAKTFPRPDYPS
jgi:hypothetical protein